MRIYQMLYSASNAGSEVQGWKSGRTSQMGPALRQCYRIVDMLKEADNDSESLEQL